MNPFLIPIISKIHFDDLAGLFTLKITWEVKSAAGNYHKETTITAATLADILIQIVQIWAGTNGAGLGTQIPYHAGDFAALGAAIAAHEPPDYAVLTFPAASEDSTTFDGEFTYDGEGDDWGATP